MTAPLEASAAFVSEYDKAYIDLQRQIQHALSDLRARQQALGGRALMEYGPYRCMVEPARAVGLSKVIKVDVSGGARMLIAAKGERLILLATGEHNEEKIWDRIHNKKRWLRERVSTARVTYGLADPHHGLFLSLEPTDGWEPYFPGEDSETWLHFLDQDQWDVVEHIYADIEDHLLEGRGVRRYLVLGAPGTGKTVVLLKILQKVLADGFNAAIKCSEEVHTFLSNSLRSKIPWLDECDDPDAPDVIVADDPGGLDEVEELYRVGERGARQVVVAAFDPLQLDQLPTMAEVRRLNRHLAKPPFILKACYRQRESLARRVVEMTDVLAHSSPFGAREKKKDFDKKYGELLKSFNELEFRYPRGAFKELRLGESATEDHVRGLLSKGRLWSHSPPILLVYEADQWNEFPRSISRCIPRDKRVEVRSDWMWQVKGVEFQHALICLTASTLAALQAPFEKSGRTKYNDRRLLRIAVSRARDSLTLIVKPNPA